MCLIYKVWERAEEFVPERFGLDGPVPNESNTDFRYLFLLVPLYYHFFDFGTTLLTFGVLGPAGARGTCTVFPFVDGFRESGRGTGVLVAGEATTKAGISRGVETVEAGVGIGEETVLGAGAMSCNRVRLGSGGLDELS